MSVPEPTSHFPEERYEPETPKQKLRDRKHEEARTQHRTVLTVLVGWEMLKAGAEFLLNLARQVSTSGAHADKSGRSDDRNLQPEIKSAAHQNWGTLFVVLAFAVALAAGIGFLFVYWSFDKTHWDASHNLLLGASLSVFFLGIGAALVFHAHWLIPRKEAIEAREDLLSPPEEREVAFEAFSTGENEIRRRGVLIGAGVLVLGTFATMVVSVLRSFASPPAPELFTTVWKRGQRLMTIDNKPISINSLQVGSTMVVFPEDQIGSEKAQTVLVRVKEEFLRLPRERASWAPMGYLAYSRVCTHAGCPVGMFEATTNLLMCPCHQSTFDALRAAQPTGGPAARPLPQLPLYADADGNLRAAGGFSDPPGPGFWGMPLTSDRKEA